MSKTHLGVALLGFGTVGSGLYQFLTTEADQIEQKYGFRFDIKKILVRNPAAARAVPIPPALLASSIQDVVNDPTVDVVVEVMGGESPAKEYILESFRAGKHVITANKKLCGAFGEKLVERARQYNRFLGFAGAVTGFHQLCPSIASSVMIRSLVGIFNGTSNYILTSMEEGFSFGEALQRAQASGYAEADPSEDVDGIDTRNKLIIVTKLAFGIFLDRDEINPVGIRQVSAIDMEFAKAFGYTIKLLGMSRLVDGDKISASVAPCLIPLTDPLASARGVYNGIRVFDALRGVQGMIASGAGSKPTAMALFSDLVSMAKGDQILWPAPAFRERTLKFARMQPPAPYYIRLNVQDHPGVLARITKVFAKADVNISNVIQRPASDGIATIVAMCGPAEERDIKRVVRELEGDTDVLGMPLLLRVEETPSEVNGEAPENVAVTGS